MKSEKCGPERVSDILKSHSKWEAQLGLALRPPTSLSSHSMSYPYQLILIPLGGVRSCETPQAIEDPTSSGSGQGRTSQETLASLASGGSTSPGEPKASRVKRETASPFPRSLPLYAWLMPTLNS